MRLKSVFISQYKNLKDFSLSFDNTSFIEVFVGKNGSGKSNLFEALIEIFRHLDQFGRPSNDITFDYRLIYESEGQDTEIEWKASKLRINKDQDRKMLGQTPFPDSVLIYYSGHNTTVSDLVTEYEIKYRGRIKGANLEDSRRFLGIGQEYRALLLAVLLVQPADSRAHTFIRRKLEIAALGITKPGTDDVSEPVLRVDLQRPDYAQGSEKEKYDIDSVDTATQYWRPVGVAKDFLETLSACIWDNTEKLIVTEGYFPNDDRYVLYLSISKLQEKFVGKWQELFRQFDNLKILGMLETISVPLRLTSGIEGNISHFSDGQFQSVYIYSIVELFKDRNCLILLDEPDAFLHPEWQFDFLRQVFDIADAAAQTSHVLMSSHSAVTLIPHEKKKIKFFDIKDNQANCYDVPKAIAIKKLSSDLIKYSEQEQLLSIINAIQIEKKPVLFTEGSTDPIILKEAWYKLYEEEMPFIPFYAFSCTYINQLLPDNRIHGEMGGLPIFALFDFDKAYDQWNGLNGEVTANDPFKGLIKKWANGESYAVMLPVPAHADIQRQVIRNPETGETFGGDSCCEIEHLFYGQAPTADYYHQEACVGGYKVVFKSDRDKTTFAKEIVPTLDKSCFETLKPVFEFIKSKCAS